MTARYEGDQIGLAGRGEGMRGLLCSVVTAVRWHEFAGVGQLGSTGMHSDRRDNRVAGFSIGTKAPIGQTTFDSIALDKTINAGRLDFPAHFLMDEIPDVKSRRWRDGDRAANDAKSGTGTGE